MRTWLCLVLSLIVATHLLALLPGCQSQKPSDMQPSGASMNHAVEDSSWLVQPGVRVGEITPASTMEDLKRIYGADNLQVAEVSVGEGETAPGMALFPNAPEKRVEVIWKDAKGRKNPESIRITGQKSLWHTPEGITLGTPLKNLEAINGGPFTLAGFGWDYSGTVFSWGDQGKLREKYQKSGTMVVLLEPSEGAPQSLMNQVMGEKVFSSAEPAMQQLNPRVSQMIVLLH